MKGRIDPLNHGSIGCVEDFVVSRRLPVSAWRPSVREQEPLKLAQQPPMHQGPGACDSSVSSLTKSAGDQHYLRV